MAASQPFAKMPRLPQRQKFVRDLSDLKDERAHAATLRELLGNADQL